MSLGNRLALELRLELSIEILLDPIDGTLGGNILRLVEGVFELLGQILNNECRPFGFSEVESFSVVTELDSINPDKVHLRLVLGSNRFNSSNVILLVVKAGVDEKVGQWLRAASIDSVVLAIDFINDRDGKILHPFLEIFLGKGRNGVGVFGFWLVKRAVYDNSGGSNASSLNGSLVSGQTKEVVVTVRVGSRAELSGRGISEGGEVSNGNDFVRFCELFVVLGGNFRNGRERLSIGQVR